MATPFCYAAPWIFGQAGYSFQTMNLKIHGLEAITTP